MALDKIEDICRLCSSKVNLLSMFNGKSRDVRRILRKLIYETVNTNIGRNDNLPKTVCFNCCVDVYNFYRFRQSCIQHEKAIKMLREVEVTSINRQKPNVNHVDLDFVTVWLAKKNANVTSTSEKSLKNTPEVRNTFTQTEHLTKSECQSVQTDKIHAEEKVIQVDIKKRSLKKATQTSHAETEETGMQTNTKSYSDKSTGTCEENLRIERNDMCIQTARTHVADKLVQTVFNKKTSRKHTQTLPVKIAEVLSETGTVTLNKEERYTEMFEKKSTDMYVQTEALDVRDEINQCDFSKRDKNSYDLKRNKIESVIKSLGKLDNTFHKSIQCDLIKNVNVSADTDVKSTQTRSFFRTHRRYTQTENEEKPHHNESFCITNEVSIVEQESQQNLNSVQENELHTNFNQTTQTSTVSCNDKGFQTDGVTTAHGSVQCELINDTTDAKILIKMDFKEEPINSLQIKTNASFDNNQPISPKTSTCSDLLKVDSRNEPVKICKMCDRILYNEKEQRQHRKTHLQCQLCKKRFTSLKSTDQHLKLCKLERESKSLSVRLVKVDNISQYSQLYKEAFHELQYNSPDDTNNS